MCFEEWVLSVSGYIEELEGRVVHLDIFNKYIFGLWCLWPILIDGEVIRFLNGLKGSCFCENVRVRLGGLCGGKNFCSTKDLRLFVSDIEECDWNHDVVDAADESASQGAMDLLCGISSLINGFLENRDDYFSNCAEVAINRVCYLIDFEMLPEYMFDKEINDQIVAMNNLVEDGGYILSLSDRRAWQQAGM